MTAAATFRDRELHAAVLDWYGEHARTLPWRSADASPWGILVSEFMLQQTPVARVLPVWEAWLTRWPDARSLAGDAPGEAVRAWGRLGYPRRALRLHAAATAIVDRHGGDVPADHDALLALPGVGSYTAAAVASFAFGQAHAVLDTNVRRVLGRVLDGAASPPPAPTVAEGRRARTLLPRDATAATWSVAVMELGALVCTARAPRCGACPVADRCAWLLSGCPPAPTPSRAQAWAGTDRQVRGRLLAVLRQAPGVVDKAALDDAWTEPVQRERALASLIVDGLVEQTPNGDYRLPGTAR